MQISRSRPRRPARCKGNSGKVRFRDHEDATRALSQLRRNGQDEGPKRVYHCPACDGWHLTSMRYVPSWVFGLDNTRPA
jgi:hypothetical protein